MKKKALLLAGLAVLVVFQAAVAWNARLYWKGKSLVAEPGAKVRVLRRAQAVYPWNDLVAFELGKACFEQGVEALGDPAARDAYFAQAVHEFLRSLRLNPGSPATHFHFAQALLYMDYLGLSGPFSYFEEYKKAAALTGHNSQIYFEVGKVLLTRWGTLTPAEQEFAVDILRRTLSGGDQAKLADMLETWSLNIRDYALVDRILPRDAAVLRAYARFIGEKGLSLKARQIALAEAEGLDFLRAKSEIEMGRREAELFRNAEASAHYAAALKALGSIKFYQRLAGRDLFDPAEFADVLKTARRLLAMSRVEETRSLADPDGAIAAYLAAEDQVGALGEFESFLKERGLVADGPTAASPMNDLAALAFRMGLDFRMNRYRDIVRVGEVLASSSLVITPAGRPSYVRILGLIGESCLKLDYVYEAERYFRQALAMDPGHLESLLGLERCYGRLNDEARAADVRATIDSLTSPRTITFSGRVLGKGETLEENLVSDGRAGTIRIEFAPAGRGEGAFVSVFFDGQVAWEGDSAAGPAEFQVSPRAGQNTLEITALNGPAALARIIRSDQGAR